MPVGISGGIVAIDCNLIGPQVALRNGVGGARCDRNGCVSRGDSVNAIKHLKIFNALNQRLSLLRATRFKDYDSRSQIQDLFLGIVDLLFNVHGEEHSRYARDTVQRAVNFIERNLSRDVTLEIVADAVDISSCYLSRLFKKTLNVNFVTYLTNRRMELAKELLVSTELPVSSIAMDLSYKDVSYFGKSFKKLVGMSPSGYRDHSRLAQGGMPAQ